MARRYSKNGSCRAACETTASMRAMAYGALGPVGAGIQPADTSRMAVTPKTAKKKMGKAGAKRVAQVLRTDAMPGCCVPPACVYTVRNNMILQGAQAGPGRNLHGRPHSKHAWHVRRQFYAARPYPKKTPPHPVRPPCRRQRYKGTGAVHRHIGHLAGGTAAIEKDSEPEAAADWNAGLPAGTAGGGGGGAYRATPVCLDCRHVRIRQQPEEAGPADGTVSGHNAVLQREVHGPREEA